jgi:VIT1/CCC1 family predicted Fe2+/Mn2+ transporter
MNEQEIKEALAHLQDEWDGAALYKALAEGEKNANLAQVYGRLAEVEEKHAARWAAELQSSGVELPVYQPTWRTRTLSFLARRFGSELVAPSVANFEQVDAHAYQQEPGSSELAADERSHARLLQSITQPLPQGLAGGEVARLEGRHRAGSGNALRAAVLGANDGLVSNMSLIMGVAGAELAGHTILVTGLAGLLAGASSMALGEWLSVQSSRELYQRQIEIEKSEVAANPAEEEEELALIYQAKGLDEARARETAKRIMSDHANAVQTLAREELGIDPDELGGSAWEAAITSFLLFAVGAIIPVLPFFFWSGGFAVIASLILSAGGLFLIGAGITLFTGHPLLYSGTRQVLFGLGAAALTYIIGRLVGVNLGG